MANNGITDHTVQNSKLVYDLVLERITFLADTVANATKLSIFTLEIMNYLEPCFRVASNDGALTPPDPSRIGVETNYSFAQKSILADLVCCYVLALKSATSMGGISEDVGPAETFISEAKAGSVEVKFEQFDVKKLVGIGTETIELYNMFKHNAATKAFNFGCIIDIYDNCTLAVEIIRSGMPRPFIIPNCG